MRAQFFSFHCCLCQDSSSSMSFGALEDVLPEVFRDFRDIAGSMRTSGSLRAFFMACLNSMSSESISYVNLSFRALSSFGFCSPVLFFFPLRVVRPVRPNFWPCSFGPGCCINVCSCLPGHVCSCLPGPRASFGRGFIQSCELGKTCPRPGQLPVTIDNPVVTDLTVLQNLCFFCFDPNH